MARLLFGKPSHRAEVGPEWSPPGLRGSPERQKIDLPRLEHDTAGGRVGSVEHRDSPRSRPPLEDPLHREDGHSAGRQAALPAIGLADVVSSVRNGPAHDRQSRSIRQRLFARTGTATPPCRSYCIQSSENEEQAKSRVSTPGGTCAPHRPLSRVDVPRPVYSPDHAFRAVNHRPERAGRRGNSTRLGCPGVRAATTIGLPLRQPCPYRESAYENGDRPLPVPAQAIYRSSTSVHAA